MNHDTTLLKKELRKEMIQRRRELEKPFIQNTSSAIVPVMFEFVKQLFPQSVERPLTIMSYMSFGQEFPTTDLNRRILEKGWQLVLPYTDSDFNIIACVSDSMENLYPSRMGILEPDPADSVQIAASDADLILVPGIAFDRHGIRLGYGKGCYDRFFSLSAGNLPPSIGLGWSFQIISRVPSEEYDLSCDYLFTEEEIIHIPAV